MYPAVDVDPDLVKLRSAHQVGNAPLSKILHYLGKWHRQKRNAWRQRLFRPLLYVEHSNHFSCRVGAHRLDYLRVLPDRSHDRQPTVRVQEGRTAPDEQRAAENTD